MTPSTPHVFIALPNLLWSVWNMSRTLLLLAQRHQNLMIKWSEEKKDVDFARNWLVKEFLETDCTHLFFLDADVEPPQDILEVLLAHDKPIIAATVMGWQNGRIVPLMFDRAPCTDCAARQAFMVSGKTTEDGCHRVFERALERWSPLRNQWIALHGKEVMNDANCRCRASQRDPWVYRTTKKLDAPTAPIEVDSVAAAALLIRRDVVEKLSPPWFRFLDKPDGEHMLSEDHYFCWRAKEAGFSVWADHKLACEHYKTLGTLAVYNFAARMYREGQKSPEAHPAIVRPALEDVLATRH